MVTALNAMGRLLCRIEERRSLSSGGVWCSGAARYIVGIASETAGDTGAFRWFEISRVYVRVISVSQLALVFFLAFINLMTTSHS